ncbi:hypothetical protein L7F22_059296 [Adiantum nelumboides]|nr:hypothetical protein [Adiantum nelumboides]
MVTDVGWEGWVTVALILLMLVALLAELAPPYLVMMGTLILFIPLDILNLEQALHGFNDPAVLAIAVLFVVAKGIELSGGLEYVSKIMFQTKRVELKPGQRLKKSDNSVVWILLRFTVPVALFSAFLANIPLVAMMIPPIVEFSRRVNMAPSKLLLPLSYAALLGGTLTLIGTGTNLVVLSLAAKKIPNLRMHLFEIGVVGVPVTVAGILYIVAISGKLLPDRLAIQPTSINARNYNIVLVVRSVSSLNRRTVEQSGLKRMPGLTLVQIEREGNIISDPKGEFILLAKDLLYFTGVIDAILALAQVDGLTLSEDEGQGQVDLNRLKKHQYLVEAVIASKSSMVHKKVSDLQFRSRYRAAVVAIHRHGARLDRAIGDVELEAGDCLLMVADGSEFVSKHRNNSTLALVSQLPGFEPVQRQKAFMATAFVTLMVAASGLGVELITSAMFSAAGLLLTKCLSPKDAMEAIELPVLIMIAAAFGISEAMVQSGAADLVARALMGLAGKSQFGLITWTYIATTLFSLAITNNAAVTIMFPVALTAAEAGNLDFRPFAYTLMLAASAGLMTPTGCPTNLMVYGPGGYRFLDYIKYGGPLQIVLLFVTVGVTISLEWWWLWWVITFMLTICGTLLAARLNWNSLNYSNNSTLETSTSVRTEDEVVEPTALGREGIMSSSAVIMASTL